MEVSQMAPNLPNSRWPIGPMVSSLCLGKLRWKQATETQVLGSPRPVGCGKSPWAPSTQELGAYWQPSWVGRCFPRAGYSTSFHSSAQGLVQGLSLEIVSSHVHHLLVGLLALRICFHSLGEAQPESNGTKVGALPLPKVCLLCFVHLSKCIFLESD